MAFVVISHWRSICSFFSDDTCCAVLSHHLRPRKRPVQTYSVICRRSPLGLLRFLNRYGNNRSLAENVACWDNTPNTPFEGVFPQHYTTLVTKTSVMGRSMWSASCQECSQAQRLLLAARALVLLAAVGAAGGSEFDIILGSLTVKEHFGHIL